MDPITITRLGQIRQQEILDSAAQSERELQPWLLALRNVLGIIWRQSNDLIERIDIADNQPTTDCAPTERSRSRS